MSERNSPVFKHSTKKGSISSLKKQPPSQPTKASKPVVLNHDIPPGTKLTFVDISHSLATIELDSKFNQFSALVDTANEWLKRNYLWKVENCETVALVFKDEMKLDPLDFGATQRLIRSSINHDMGDCILLNGLRLWISRRENVPEMRKHVDIQEIAYKTYLPQGCRIYENQIGWQQLDDIIQVINESLKTGLISGQLLNIESVVFAATEDWLVDTECPKQHRPHQQHRIHQQTALRVFYVSNAYNDCLHQHVAIFDFVPDVIRATTPPKFEPFSTLLYKVQDFMEDNPEYKYLNTQSVDVKFKSLDEMHTHFMVYTDEFTPKYYLRILRLVCTKPLSVRHKRLERHLSFKSVGHPNEIKSYVMEREDTEAHKQCSAANAPVINIDSQVFEIRHNLNVLHGPFYPVKRAIEEFMERPEWVANDEQRPDRRWKYLCSETIIVLAKDEAEIERKADVSLFSNRNLFILAPRIYYAIRIFFDTTDVIPDRNYRSGHKMLKKCQSESLEKKSINTTVRNQSLPVGALQYIETTTESVPPKTMRQRIQQSVACSII